MHSGGMANRANGNSAPRRQSWFLYLVECEDATIYTGIAVDVAARFEAHQKGTGARYTRAHPPKGLLAVVEFSSRSAASRAEYMIKQLTPREKREFAQGAHPLQPVEKSRTPIRLGTAVGYLATHTVKGA